MSECSITAEGISMPRRLRLSSLTIILLAFPIAYFVISYSHLAWWHDKVFLWETLTHENGRLTLAGSMFYFDHFVACVPMILIFALCTAGGFALAGQVSTSIDRSRASFVAGLLLTGAALMILIAFAASVYTAGWERTLNYAFQRIERDGVMSKGGNWNQLQLSNIPIALGAIAVSSTLVTFSLGSYLKRDARLIKAGKLCIAAAAVLMIGISVFSFDGWQAFLNPRWMAHSIRELATYPLTGIPIALIGILLVERYISGIDSWLVEVRSISLILLGIGIAIVAGQLLFLRNVDVLAIAQKPAFSEGGLSVSYLLSSHVFEHVLDFILIGPLTAGIYALLRVRSA